MTLDMRGARVDGKEGLETMSLNVRCGSAVMRQTRAVGEVWSECGSALYAVSVHNF